MKSLHKNNYGFAHIGLILLAVLVITAIGGVGYYVAKKSQSDTSNTDQSTNKQATSKSALASIDSIKSEIKKEFPDAENKETPPTIYVPYSDSLRLSLTADLDVIIAVSSEQDITTTKDKIASILNQNNLKGNDLVFENNDLYCYRNSLNYLGDRAMELACITKDNLTKYINIIPAIKAAVQESKPDIKVYDLNFIDFTYYTTPDKSVEVAEISGSNADKDLFPHVQYLALKGGNWTVVAEDSGEITDPQPPCSVLNEPEYKGLFANPTAGGYPLAGYCQ